MEKNNPTLPLFKSFLFIAILCSIIYSNTLHCGWHLDDYHNIIQNPQVHISQLNTESITEALYAASQADGLNRPLAFLSFSLNWLWGHSNVVGFHIVNIIIHISTAVFLFHAIGLLFQTPNLKGWDSQSVYFTALLSAAMWAIHPIQIQAVTYIVQRMASMAALFYIIGLLCFLKARLASLSFHRWMFALFCCLSFLLSIASKNNAMALPVIILLVEFIFFRDLGQNRTQIKALAFLTGITLLVTLAGVVLFMGSDGAYSLFEGYEKRPFSLQERILTQPRVVLFYLSQIFYPIADRFSITHDLSLSTSFFHPWTTLPAILLILLLLGFALWRIRRNPLLSFSILFFFGNHLIESTILPLEMIFEHRNYLPSLFLFIPLAVGIKIAFDHFASCNRPMYQFLVISVCAVIIGVGLSTYIRNSDWRSERTLWLDAMEKAPKSARPIHNLAWGYYEQIGNFDMAIALYKEALRHRYDKLDYKADSYNNLGSIYYRRNNYTKAVYYAEKAVSMSPSHNNANLLLCNSLAKLGRYEEALALINELLLEAPYHSALLYLKGSILLQLSKPKEAWQTFRKCLAMSPGNNRYLRQIGVCLTQMGYNERGFWLLKRSKKAKEESRTDVLLVIADNRLRAGEPDAAKKWIKRFISKAGIENAKSALTGILTDPLSPPLAKAEIALLVADSLKDHSEQYAETAARLTMRFSDQKNHTTNVN